MVNNTDSNKIIIHLSIWYWAGMHRVNCRGLIATQYHRVDSLYHIAHCDQYSNENDYKISLVPIKIVKCPWNIQGYLTHRAKYGVSCESKVWFLYYCKVSNIRRTKCHNLNFLVLARSCLCAIYWSQVLSGEWRCSWSSADRRCSNNIWVINNLIAY